MYYYQMCFYSRELLSIGTGVRQLNFRTKSLICKKKKAQFYELDPLIHQKVSQTKNATGMNSEHVKTNG